MSPQNTVTSGSKQIWESKKRVKNPHLWRACCLCCPGSTRPWPSRWRRRRRSSRSWRSRMWSAARTSSTPTLRPRNWSTASSRRRKRWDRLPVVSLVGWVGRGRWVVGGGWAQTYSCMHAPHTWHTCIQTNMLLLACMIFLALVPPPLPWFP